MLNFDFLEKVLGIVFLPHFPYFLKKQKEIWNKSSSSFAAWFLKKNIGYLCFPASTPGPDPRPEFVFEGPGPNLYLAAPPLKLYLPALAYYNRE